MHILYLWLGGFFDYKKIAGVRCMPASYKVEEVKKLVSKLENAKALVFVDYKGISVNENAELKKICKRK